MKTVSITELKAKLSQYLDAVQAGQEVIVTERGRPIARIVRVEGAGRLQARVERLMREGRLRPPRRHDPIDFSRVELPPDPEGRALDLLLQEREEGR